jgi:head-tail adaptor
MLSNLLNHTVTVNRPTDTPDTSGGISESFSAVYSNIPANIQPVSASWLIQYAQRKIDVSHSVYFNQALTINTGDQIAYGSRTLLVKGVRDLIELGRVVVVDCLELK